MVEQLGGFQIRQWQLQTNSMAAASDGDSGDELKAIDAGFEFIETSYRENKVPAAGVKQLHWITTQLHSKTSPLWMGGPFKWTDRLVEKAFRKLTEEGSLAQVVANCPDTIMTLSPWLVDEVLVHLVPHLTTKALGLVGKAGIGKTPVVEAIACAFSRYWKRKLHRGSDACFRTACDLDFFRGEVGCVDSPDALDDCDPQTTRASKWKAFCDVGRLEVCSEPATDLGSEP